MSDTLKIDIFDAMVADGDLGALIGDDIYPDIAPQDVGSEYITYQMTADEGEHHQTGGGNLRMTDIQFNVWSGTSENRTLIKDAVIALFDVKIRQTFGNTFITRSINTNNTDTREDDDDGSQNFSYGVFMDFQIWHER